MASSRCNENYCILLMHIWIFECKLLFLPILCFVVWCLIYLDCESIWRESNAVGVLSISRISVWQRIEESSAIIAHLVPIYRPIRSGWQETTVELYRTFVSYTPSTDTLHEKPFSWHSMQNLSRGGGAYGAYCLCGHPVLHPIFKFSTN